MGCSKKYCNLPANSLLESVLALSIISICLYIAVMVFAAIFTPRTSARFYATQNNVNAIFFELQAENDSIQQSDVIQLEEENIEKTLKKVTVRYKDSTNIGYEKHFYVQGQ